MASELDPMLVNALRLLHSRHPKSLEQLCALRDEVLGKKPGSTFEFKVKKEETKDVKTGTPNKPTPSFVNMESAKSDHEEAKNIVKDSHPPLNQNMTATEKDEVMETVEVESSYLNSKAQGSCNDMIETVEELDSSLFETLEELTSSSTLLSKKKKGKMDDSGGKSIPEEIDLASRESSPDHEISADLGIFCIICMSGKAAVAGNLLVECHECHEHYHQNCHKPVITDQNINDPRHVWYCSSCVRRMKEATSTTTATTKSKPIILPGLSFKSQTQSFKPPVRTEGKPLSFLPTSPSLNQSFSIPSLTGASTGNNSSNLKSPNNACPRDVTRSSMKRLQQVKKKAAAKNQQRFTKR